MELDISCFGFSCSTPQNLQSLYIRITYKSLLYNPEGFVLSISSRDATARIYLTCTLENTNSRKYGCRWHLSQLVWEFCISTLVELKAVAVDKPLLWFSNGFYPCNTLCDLQSQTFFARSFFSSLGTTTIIISHSSLIVHLDQTRFTERIINSSIFYADAKLHANRGFLLWIQNIFGKLFSFFCNNHFNVLT